MRFILSFIFSTILSTVFSQYVIDCGELPASIQEIDIHSKGVVQFEKAVQRMSVVDEKLYFIQGNRLYRSTIYFGLKKQLYDGEIQDYSVGKHDDIYVTDGKTILRNSDNIWDTISPVNKYYIQSISFTKNGAGVALVLDTMKYKLLYTKNNGEDWEVKYKFLSTEYDKKAKIERTKSGFYINPLGASIIYSLDYGRSWMHDSLRLYFDSDPYVHTLYYPKRSEIHFFNHTGEASSSNSIRVNVMRAGKYSSLRHCDVYITSNDGYLAAFCEPNTSCIIQRDRVIEGWGFLLKARDMVFHDIEKSKNGLILSGTTTAGENFVYFLAE